MLSVVPRNNPLIMNAPTEKRLVTLSTNSAALRQLVTWLSLVPSTLFAVSFFGHWSDWAELLVNFQVQFLIMLVPCPVVLFWLGARRRAAALVAVTICCAWGVGKIYFPATQPPAGPNSLRIMSYNVLGTNLEFEAVAKEISHFNPDVLVILEFTQNWEQALRVFHERYPHRVTEPRWHGFGIAVFSKLPIEDFSIIDSTQRRADLPIIRARFKFHERFIELIGLHFVSPLNGNRMSLRNLQFRELAKELASRTGPRIVVGDFNCTTWSNHFCEFLLQTQLRDSRQGFGLQATWAPSYLPLQIPIDHALVSREIHVHDRQIGERNGSDHRPVIIDLSISQSSVD